MKEKYHAKVLRDSAYPYILVSYAYDKGRTWLGRLGYDFSGMLDSGAFSVRSKGLEVDLGEYIEWAKAYVAEYPNLRVTNLDVIPKVTDTKRVKLKASKESADNAERIRSEGLRVVEVHHLPDPISSFEAMIERRRPGEVIGVAGLGSKTENVGEMFGDGVFARLRDTFGWDHLPPVHGFGVAAEALCYRYPLASIDASTWVAPDRFGQVYERGKLVTRKRHSGYLRHSDVAVSYGKSILGEWRQREDSIRDYWLNRGVVIEEEGLAVVTSAVRTT